ncbi:MAG: ribosomal protein S18-alanine N-acetyltransferase [Candidatus Nanopelagicales bacterium]
MPAFEPGPGSTALHDLTLGPLRWWDLDEVLALERSLFEDTAWTPGQFWSELARVPESRWYTVARRGGRIVGYAGIFQVGPQADVQTIAVAGHEQGRGTGRLLLSALIARAGAAGARLLHLEVRADNASALALYEHLGFVVDGRRRDYYGRGRDGVLMSLRLAGPPDPGSTGVRDG